MLGVLEKMGLIWKSKLGRLIWWIKGCFDSLKVMLLVFNHHNDSSLMPKFWYFGVGNVGFWVSRERSSQKQAKGWWTSEEGARLYSQNTKKVQQKNPSRVTGWPQPVQPVHQPVTRARFSRFPVLTIFEPRMLWKANFDHFEPKLTQICVKSHEIQTTRDRYHNSKVGNAWTWSWKKELER